MAVYTERDKKGVAGDESWSRRLPLRHRRRRTTVLGTRGCDLIKRIKG